jgi:predicted transcriptional regulator
MIDYEMRRGYFDRAAAVLEAASKQKTRAPSRILAGLGISYTFLETLIIAGLIRVEKVKKRNRIILTSNGRNFLHHYGICEMLLPT